MYEVFVVLFEKPGKPREESIEHWAGNHSEIGLALPGLRKYTQYRSVGAPGGASNPYLGIAALTFDSEQAFIEMTQSKEFQDGVTDLEKFTDSTQIPMFGVETVKYL